MSMEKFIFLFSDNDATQQLVGGKGYSLIKMAHGDFPVPAGMVLGVNFFNDWLKELNTIKGLSLLATDNNEMLRSKTAKLQQAAAKLQLSNNQKQNLYNKLKSLDLPDNQLYSVRSSSPEEDMEGASFAGMYETYLGVNKGKLENRIRDVFISCIDYRVVAYKRQKGFDFTSYSIAVVVMTQIKSEVAGVAFSINPLNNCYDEVVINANFGLGESVVSGNVVPDEFVVDKYKNIILSEKIGNKKESIIIDKDGGTSTVSHDNKNKATLSNVQILELAKMVKKVEEYYGIPMDTEWAYADNKFYMLQARPITTYIPLHPNFLTKPGEPKKLYLDLTLIEQGIQKPLSVMGTDCFRMLSNYMGLSAAGVALAEKPGDFMYAAGGRAYINLSEEMLMEGQKGTAKEYEGLDTYTAQVIRDTDMSCYKGSYATKGIWKAIKASCVGLFKSHDMISGILKGNKHPEELRKDIDEKGKLFIKETNQLDKSDISFNEFTHQSMQKAADFMIHTSIPSLIDAEAAKNGLNQLFKKELKGQLLEEADKIDRGLPYNVTMDMNCRIYELMTLLDKKELESVETLRKNILNRDLSDKFLGKWDEFIELYGFRGPREVDIKTPRYQDNHEIIIQQMQSYSTLDATKSPSAILEYQSAAREKAYKVLLANIKDKKKLEKLYNILVNLGGYREIHKYYMVYAGEKIRRKAIKIAQRMVSQNRLDTQNDIFYLTPDEVQQAVDNSSVDVRKIINHHKEYMSIAEKIEHYPPVIDSRGKILRPKRKKTAEGEIQGDPVSAGKVTGKIVIVNYVGEKDIKEGDILAAKAADPGWTPLFINASGILLEVGGMLQHGSLIAREYGKPCIAGIENLTELVNDGDKVTMDGSTGIINKL